MTHAVPRAVVEAFFDAYSSRDAERIGVFLDDNVEWHVVGPKEIMQVCGQWYGKAAVMDRFAGTVPKIVEFKSLQQECLLVDGDSCALLGRISCTHRATGRAISHRVAQFARFRDEKIVWYRCINDSLDAAEQFVGHHLGPSIVPDSNESDLVVI